MAIIKRTFFKVKPRGAMRSTKNMFWLTAISEEEAEALDAKWQKKITRIGEMWVTMKRDKKTGEMKEFARKSAPNYVRQRKYLTAQYEATKAVQMQAQENGFSMPEDDFMLIAYIAMPKSWTQKKKALMDGQRHKSTPDSDNIVKQFCDSIFQVKSRAQRLRNDKCISSFASIKIWVSDENKEGIEIVEFEPGTLDLLLTTK